MNKTLKKAVKNYEKKVRQPVTIDFQEEHIPTILKALEVYQRLKLGQIDNALDEAFGYSLAYEDKKEIHNCARKYLFKGTDIENNPNASYGIFSEEVGDATMAYEIYKVLGRYKAFKDNDGWADWSRRFDKPYSHTRIPLPVVQGAIEHKDFKIPKRLWKKLDEAYASKETTDWEKIWGSIDRAMFNLPRGEKSEILNFSWDIGTTESQWIVRVTAPIKPKDKEEK
jgi:hypothetical protein